MESILSSPVHYQIFICSSRCAVKCYAAYVTPTNIWI